MSIPSVPLIDASKLEAVLKKFSDVRDWNKFHTPKNLLLALTGEVGELVEIFQWLTEEESLRIASNPKTTQSVCDELADVFIYLVRLSTILGVDLNNAVEMKLVKNSEKYPPKDFMN